jgi:hypothetical protein
VREACSEVHSLASWLSGRAYRGREKVEIRIITLNYDSIEKKSSSCSCDITLFVYAVLLCGCVLPWVIVTVNSVTSVFVQSYHFVVLIFAVPSLP